MVPRSGHHERKVSGQLVQKPGNQWITLEVCCNVVLLFRIDMKFVTRILYRRANDTVNNMSRI